MTNQSILTKEEVQASYARKRAFFDAGNTRSYEFRIQQLTALRDCIHAHEIEILDALHMDMRKPRFEATISELVTLYDEIELTLANLKEWMQPTTVATPEMLSPGSSEIHREPLGIVLIIGPWNYPFQLALAPLVGAIAAGNCVIIKPSNETYHTALVIEKIISTAFAEEYISVVKGPGSAIGPLIIKNNRFDHIFFTGSPGVGKLIAGMAAQHLTPITLELGGKSPVIFDKYANIEVSARRLTWSKFFNAGQTCICPDYVLAHEDVKDQLIQEIQKNITVFFGEDPQKSPDLARVVNDKRFNALKQFLTGDIVAGGKHDAKERYIAPTIIDNVSMDDPIMHDEIFGPILPILTWSAKNEALKIIRKNRYPLACYIFSENQETVNYFIERVENGGTCVNNCLLHVTNPELPFGGVGFSGMGRYHGRETFLTLSHSKSVLRVPTSADNTSIYAPYDKSIGQPALITGDKP